MIKNLRSWFRDRCLNESVELDLYPSKPKEVYPYLKVNNINGLSNYIAPHQITKSTQIVDNQGIE
jgi:hypothetical protein